MSVYQRLINFLTAIFRGDNTPQSIKYLLDGVFDTYRESWLTNRILDRYVATSNPVSNTELYDWSTVESYEYTQPETVQITGTACDRPLPADIQSYFGRYDEPSLLVSEIPDATLTDCGAVFTTDGRLIYNTLGNSESLYRFYLAKNLAPVNPQLLWSETPLYSSYPEPTETIPQGFNLVRRGSYYHWVTEALPKLRALEHYEQTTGETIPLITERDPPSWVMGYLSILGLDDRVVSLPARSVTVEALVSSPRRDRDQANVRLSNKDLEWVRDRFHDCLDITGDRPPTRIFVSRGDADFRRISNQNQLYDKLSKLGFERYRLSEYSVPEQIRLFSSAECVVGAHGAGLTNVLFAENTGVFEIRPGGLAWHDYYCMAEQLGHQYEYHIATVDNRTDMTVDVDCVYNRVKRLLKT